jgi:hypothetical protein
MISLNRKAEELIKTTRVSPKLTNFCEHLIQRNTFHRYFDFFKKALSSINYPYGVICPQCCRHFRSSNLLLLLTDIIRRK